MLGWQIYFRVGIDTMTSRLMNTAHKIASDLYEADVISAVTMREYEALALAPVDELSPVETKKRDIDE
jgi:DNA-binding transcriptional regulator YiaG